MDFQFTLLLIVAVLSTVQSIFGIGLLVFGTPILLLMDIPFNNVLSILLPSSILISLAQVLQARVVVTIIQKKMIGYSTLGVLTGLIIVFNDYFNIDIKIFVGVGLIISSFLRISKVNTTLLRENILEKFCFYSFLMGLIHGISNMGGGILTFLSSTIYSNKKDQRYNIALGYLVFGLVQLALLFIFKLNEFSLLNVILIMISVASFMTIGNRVYQKTSEMFFDHSMTFIIFIFGFTVLISSFLEKIQ